MKRFLIFLAAVLLSAGFGLSVAAEEPAEGEYIVGTDDLLEVNILQPEALTTAVTVAPDGAVMIPYIGRVNVAGMSLSRIEAEIHARLSDGYMRYPVVSVALKESRSRRFFVYGEVIKPGAYQIEENTTVLKAVCIAGGFSKYGSSSKVKVLRPKQGKPGYDTLKVNIQALMNGSDDEDVALEAGDIVVVSEGMF
ncbi:MAG: polysaccharide biosynthesis/export family protein [Candidatus Omnitrophota bacterium]